MFEIDTPSKAKVTDVRVLSQKNRDKDDEPGAQICISIEMSNDALSMFDGFLKGALYSKRANGTPQQGLEGIEPISDMPNLTTVGKQVGTFGWHQDLIGYTLAIQYGIEHQAAIESDGCKVIRMKITPKEGGTVNLAFAIDAPNISEAMFGRLARLKSREVDLSLFAPLPSAQKEIEVGEPPKQ